MMLITKFGSESGSMITTTGTVGFSAKHSGKLIDVLLLVRWVDVVVRPVVERVGRRTAAPTSMMRPVVSKV
jgi:hypothetical protein